MTASFEPSEFSYEDFLLREDPLGPFAIKPGNKARKQLLMSERNHVLACRMLAVENGILRVIHVMLTGYSQVSAYFRVSYADDFKPSVYLSISEGESRVTLSQRFHDLMAWMKSHAKQYDEWNGVSYASLKHGLDLFGHYLSRALSEGSLRKFNDFRVRFDSLWSSANVCLDDETSVVNELESLMRQFDAAFEELRDGFLERERAMAEEQSAKGEIRNLSEKFESTTEAVENLSEKVGANTRQSKAVLRKYEQQAARERDQGDNYSRLAGLDRVNAACREELCAVFRYSHEKPFPVKRVGKGCGSSIRALVETVWRLNQDRFEELARQKKDPGYANVTSLVSRIYKLINSHPEADYFLWQA